MDLLYFKKREELFKQQQERITAIETNIQECQNDESVITKIKKLLGLERIQNFTNLNMLDNRRIIVYVTIGKVNSSKSTLSEMLASRGEVSEENTRISFTANYKDDEIHVYKYNNEENSFIVDTGGSITHNYKRYFTELPNKIKNKIQENLDETERNKEYIFVFLLLTNSEKLIAFSPEEKSIIKSLIKENHKWLICFTKFDKYINHFKNLKDGEINKAKNEHLKTRLEQFADGLKLNTLLSKIYFIELKDINSKYNELDKLQKRMKQIAYDLDVFDVELNKLLNANEESTINIGIFGKNNVGKSSLVNAILGEEKAKATTNIEHVKKKSFLHPTFQNIQIIDNEGYSDNPTLLDDEEYALIILVIDSNGCDAADKKLINSILKQKLFIVETHIDENDEINDKNTFEDIKKLNKESHCSELDLINEDTNYYLVSLKKEYINEKKVNDLNIFLKDIIDKGLDDSQKEECFDYKKDMNIDLIEKIRQDALSNGIGKSGSFVFNLLPIVGDIYDLIYFKKFIKYYCKKLKLVGLTDNNSIMDHFKKKFSDAGLTDFNRLNEIREKYSEFKDSENVYECIYNDALEKFKKISKLPDFYFELKKKTILDKQVVVLKEVPKSATKFAVVGFLGVIDDIARLVPKLSVVLGTAGFIAVGAISAVASLAIGAFSVYYMTKMTELIVEILIDDAKFLYIGSFLSKRHSLYLDNEKDFNDKTENLHSKSLFKSSSIPNIMPTQKTNFFYIFIGIERNGKSTIAKTFSESEQRVFFNHNIEIYQHKTDETTNKFGINYYIIDAQSNIARNYQEWLFEKLETEIEHKIIGNNQYTYILVLDSSRPFLEIEKNILLNLIEKRRSWLLCFNKFDQFIEQISSLNETVNIDEVNRDEAKEKLLKNYLQSIKNMDLELLLSKTYFNEFPQNGTPSIYNELTFLKLKETIKSNILEDIKHLESDQDPFINIFFFGKENVGKTSLKTELQKKTKPNSSDMNVQTYPTEKHYVYTEKNMIDGSNLLEQNLIILVIKCSELNGLEKEFVNRIPNEYKSRLFIVDTHLDLILNASNTNEFENYKTQMKTKIIDFLELESEFKNYYLVSTNPDHIENGICNDLQLFLANSLLAGLDNFKKTYYASSEDAMNTMKRNVVSKKVSDTTGTYFFYLLPLLGNSSDFPYFRAFIIKYCKKLRLIKLHESDRTILNYSERFNSIIDKYSNFTDSENIYKNIYNEALNILSTRYNDFETYFSLKNKTDTKNDEFIKNLEKAGKQYIRLSNTLDELNISDSENIGAIVEAIIYSATGETLNLGVVKFSVFYMRLMTKTILEILISDAKQIVNN